MDKTDTPPRPGDPWTPPEINVLTAGFWAGHTDDQIADHLPARSPRAVEIKRHRLDLLHREEITWSDAEDEALLRARKNGTPYEQLAPVFGRSIRSLRTRHTRLNAVSG